LGTLIAYLVAIIICSLCLKPILALTMPWHDLGLSLLATLGMGLAVWLLPLTNFTPGVATLLIKASIGGIVYVALAYIFNLLNIRVYVSDMMEKSRS